jgi:hypothetical protein
VLRIRDVYPGFQILIFTHPGSRISDPKTATKERGEKKNFLYLFCSHKFHKIENYFIFEMLIIHLGQFSRNYRTFYPKNCHQALKNMCLVSGIRDPKSEIRKKTYSGSRIHGSKRHRIPVPDPQHWIKAQK